MASNSLVDISSNIDLDERFKPDIDYWLGKKDQELRQCVKKVSVCKKCGMCLKREQIIWEFEEKILYREYSAFIAMVFKQL